MATIEAGGTQARWRKQLLAGLKAMGISADEEQLQQLVDYLALLLKWNRAYNLTAVRSPGEMVSRQLLDSLSILPFLQGPRVLDIGTGAGLPGVPLAIIRRDLEFVLLDSNSKKTRFVNQVRMELGLENLQVAHSRVEAFEAPVLFQTITSRAFASLDDMLRSSEHLLADGGQWLAMKGQNPTEEVGQLGEYVIRVVPLTVPSEKGHRHVVVIQH